THCPSTLSLHDALPIFFTSVDLPAPFSPTRACASPGYSSIDTSTMACTAPKDLAACRSTRTGASACAPSDPAASPACSPPEAPRSEEHTSELQSPCNLV